MASTSNSPSPLSDPVADNFCKIKIPKNVYFPDLEVVDEMPNLLK